MRLWQSQVGSFGDGRGGDGELPGRDFAVVICAIAVYIVVF